MSATASRRGSFPRPKGRSQQVQDDTEEVRNLRAKYSDQLSMIRELFPTWTDEDLLFALQESLGDVENAVVRISEGQVEQFSSVKSKKQVKKESGHSTSAPQAASAAPSTAPHAARGNHVGTPAGRGRGGASLRGARGGRGGFRGVGGRGGGIAPQANGHDAKSPETIEATTAQAFAPIATPTSGTSWAAALSRSNNKSQPTPAAPAVPAPAPALEKEATDASLGAPAEPLQPAAPVAEVVAPQATESATTTGALTSSAEGSVPAVKVPAPSKATLKAGGMSWAQIARKSEAPKPVAAPAPASQSESAPVAPEPEAAASAPVTDAPAPESTIQTQPESSIEQSTVAAEEPAVESAAEPVASTDAVTGTQETAANASTLTESTTAPDTAVAADDAGAANASAVAPPGLSKSTPRVGAQRSSQRARQDAPVVMAGGSSQLDKLGVQFGSLNFLGGDGDDAPESTNEAVPNQSQTEAAPIAATSPSIHRQDAQVGQVQADSYNQQPASAQYNGFKSDSFDNSYGFTGQQQQQQAQPAAPHQQQQQASQEQIHGYNGYSSISQNQQSSQPQSQSQPQQGLQDYSSMYGGLDTQRLAQFYGAYDQSSNAFGQRSDDKAQPQASQQAQQSQHQTASQQGNDLQGHQPQHHQAGPGLHQQQAPQQQFPGIMPYYYPHYYMPNQFQHYAQPAAGYGQYPVYGQPAGQPQHTPKPGTPGNVASPYNQGPQSDANAYGAQNHYGQAPSSAGLSSYDQGFGRGMPGLGGMSDYSKIYSGAGAIPGLGGFLGSGAGGAPPSQTAASGNATSGNNGTPHMGSQQKAGASAGSALDSYRQFDANASKGSGQSGSTSSQVGRSQAQSQGVPQQHQQGQQQQQQAQQQQQQQQQYYQQYGAYGHQASSNAYSNYPYARQYWGQ